MPRTLSTDWTLELSSLATIFPAHSEEDTARVFDSIKDDSRIPVVKVGREGTIIDGRTRYKICKSLGTPFILDDDPVEDELKYVVQENLARRHLSALQVATIVSQLADPETTTVNDRARIAGVSRRTQQLADREEREGRGDEVIAGERTMSDVQPQRAPQRNDSAPSATQPRSARSEAHLRDLRGQLAIAESQRNKAEERVQFLEAQMMLEEDEENAQAYRSFQTLQEELDVTKRQRDNYMNEAAQEKARADGYLERIKQLERGR